MTAIRSSSLLPLIGAALLVTSACGRSSLGFGPGAFVEEGGSGAQGGQGGEGGLGGSPTTGGGGEGGLPLDCSVLEVEGPIGVAGGLSAHQRQPALVAVDDQQVLLAMEWTDASVPAAPQEVRHTSFFPWGFSLPETDAAPSYLADFDRGYSFDATTSTEGRFALLAADEPSGFIPPTFNPYFVPGDGGLVPGITLQPVAEIAFVEHDGQGHFLFGILVPTGPGSVALFIGMYSLDDLDQIALTMPPALVGCANTPPRAEAKWMGERWLVAAGIAMSGSCNGPSPGPANALQTLIVEPSGATIYIGFQPTIPIDQVDLVRTETGAVALWTAPGDNFGGPILSLPLDAAGNPLQDPSELPIDPTVVPGGWAAGRFGEGLLVTWRSGADGTLRAQRLSPSLEPLGATTLPSSEVPVGRPDVLGAPDGTTRAVVAQPVLAGTSDQMRIFRVACP